MRMRTASDPGSSLEPRLEFVDNRGSQRTAKLSVYSCDALTLGQFERIGPGHGAGRAAHSDTTRR
jgi:hypothetical protein